MIFIFDYNSVHFDNYENILVDGEGSKIISLEKNLEIYEKNVYSHSICVDLYDNIFNDIFNNVSIKVSFVV